MFMIVCCLSFIFELLYQKPKQFTQACFVRILKNHCLKIIRETKG